MPEDLNLGIDEAAERLAQALSSAAGVARRGQACDPVMLDRDISLREDANRYREVNGVQILVTLHTLVDNALRLDGIWSITGASPHTLTKPRAC